MLKDKRLWVLFVLLMVYIDQITKLNAMSRLADNQVVQLMPGLKFQLAFNTGAAFSLLSNGYDWQRYLLLSLSILMSVGLVNWLAKLEPFKQWESLSISMILAGALGNLWDRLVFGYVVDFISIYYKDWHWPTFNIADSLISVGVFILLLTTLFETKPPVHTLDRMND